MTDEAKQNGHKAHTDILLVDDEILTRELISVQLSHLGYQVTELDSGMQAIREVDSKAYDLVLLDLEMPGLSGMEVLEHIRLKYTPLNLPIIMVTADDNEKSIIEALQKGANDYLVKPVSMEVADARIKTHMHMSELLKVKDEFLGFASHDLKKPLMLIEDIAQELGQQLEKEQVDKQELQELVTLILNTNKSMTDVVKGFLDQSARRTGMLEIVTKPVDINSIAANVLRMNRNYGLQKHISLQISLDQKVPVIRTDPFRLNQVLENVVGNAIKFSEANTSVSISTGYGEAEVSILVSDEGPGFKQEELEKAFIRNAKISNRPTGKEESSGIGLPLCLDLIEQIGGRISVANNESCGATFTIAMPVV